MDFALTLLNPPLKKSNKQPLPHFVSKRKAYFVEGYDKSPSHSVMGILVSIPVFIKLLKRSAILGWE